MAKLEIKFNLDGVEGGVIAPDVSKENFQPCIAVFSRYIADAFDQLEIRGNVGQAQPQEDKENG